MMSDLKVAHGEVGGHSPADAGKGLRLLTREELAETLGVSVRTVHRMLADGEITPVRVRERLIRFYLPDVVRELVVTAMTRKHGRGAGVERQSVERDSVEPQYPRRVE
jgi:excisionase family DNA binding protein